MFSDMLKYLRMRSGLNQTQLAEKLGIGRSTLAMYETGRREPPFELLEAIADFFNVNMDTLMGRDTAPAPAITPDEQLLLDLFRSIPESDRALVLQMIRAALSTKGLL